MLRLTSTGFYLNIASKIGHASGLLAILAGLILITLRIYFLIDLDMIENYHALSDIVFVVVELYIIYGLIMLKVVTAKLPPGLGQIQPNRYKLP